MIVNSKTDKDDVSAAANDYLKTLGFVSIAYAWIKVLEAVSYTHLTLPTKA